MNDKKHLHMLNEIIILPDDYYLFVSDYDKHLISLCKKKNGIDIVIEQFILENYDHGSIVRLGLAIGEILDI